MCHLVKNTVEILEGGDLSETSIITNSHFVISIRLCYECKFRLLYKPDLVERWLPTF
jgi:hypothetical protein